MRSRCSSARVVGPGRLDGWVARYDKPSTDGSAKLNIRRNPRGSVPGVLYGIEDGERQNLDGAEPGYTPVMVEVDGTPALTYTFEGQPTDAAPYAWYVAMAKLGAASHGITTSHLEAEAEHDPVAPGVRPATLDDMPLIQSILSSGLKADTNRYYAHPGDYAWWVYHDDPRHPDHLSSWIQDDSGFVTIDSVAPNEMSVFTLPGIDRMPLIDWAQRRRLGGRGDVGWVSDEDTRLVDVLSAEGYRPAETNRWYRWDLSDDLPTPEIPRGWALRPVAGEEEANSRRAASHAAFESSMPSAMHLQRYLNFMRSPVYVPHRDLVAVAPDGTVSSFMIWWADESGVAQIEPFGTHPRYQRQGLGRALIHHALGEMRAAGMHTCRVMTDESGDATAFYEGVGFEHAGRVRWWRPP